KYTGSTSTMVEEWTLRDLGGKALTVYETVGGNGGIWTWKKDYVHDDRSLVAAETDVAWPRQRLAYTVDHLGSPRLITTASGGLHSEHHYLGFGDELTGSAGEELLFTGHERDHGEPGAADDLDYMLARYYSPQMGRFLSVDPARSLTSSERPQTWNRYAYALNNPLAYVDPDGEQVQLIFQTVNASNVAIGSLANTAAFAANNPGTFILSSPNYSAAMQATFNRGLALRVWLRGSGSVTQLSGGALTAVEKEVVAAAGKQVAKKAIGRVALYGGAFLFGWEAGEQADALIRENLGQSLPEWVVDQATSEGDTEAQAKANARHQAAVEWRKQQAGGQRGPLSESQQMALSAYLARQESEGKREAN
ncbi:MAG: RHS repeat-associated core domain-containing protein, partial [Acidobacteria bacterium]|nr:RHS repeat-associated core domain-containing protein [Acidobacteriota bacterium]